MRGVPTPLGREARLVAFGRSLWGLADGMLALAVPLYLVDLGAGGADVGAVLGTGAAIGALAVLPAAAVAGRVGRTRVIVASALAPLAGTLAYLPLASWRGAFAASALYSCSLAALPLMNAHVAANTARGSLGRAMGFTYGVSMIGAIAAAPLAGAVADRYSLRAVVALAAAIYVGFVAALLSLRPDAPVARPHAGLRVDRRRYAPVLASVLVTSVFYLPIVLLPLYLRDVRGIPVGMLGVLLAGTSLGGSLLAAAAGYVAERVGIRRSLVVAASILAAGCVAIAQEPLVIVALGLVLLGAQVGMNPILAVLVGRLLPDNGLSMGYATLQIATRLGMAAAAFTAGMLYARDPSLPLFIAASLAVPAAAVVGSAADRRRP